MICVSAAAMIGVAAGLIAGVKLLPRFVTMAPDPNSAHTPGAAPVAQLWTCGMHPHFIQDHPGSCPICHMDLTPVSASSASPGTAASSTGDAAAAPSDTLFIDPAIVQNMGVRTVMVSEQPLHRSIRAFGYLEESQENIRDINLRFGGWVKRLYAHAEGMLVHQGDPLMDVYSPDLQLAIGELISARRELGTFADDQQSTVQQSAQSLFDSALRRLELWDLPRTQLEALAKLDQPPDSITIVSPMTGFVTDKPVVEGAAVQAGVRVLRIVDYSTLWLDAAVFEKDLSLIQVGQNAKVSIASQYDTVMAGKVVFIQPRVDELTRTARVRVEIPNPELTWRPGMYATVRLEAPISDKAVAVPREAILDTGERQVAIVAREAGHFEPREIVAGAAGDDGMVQVLSGLDIGDQVVVSGQFLLDAESRLRETIRKFLHEGMIRSAGDASRSGKQPQDDEDPESIPVAIDAASQRHVDSVMRVYLEMAVVLGRPQSSDQPLDPQPLADAAALAKASLSAPESVVLANALTESIAGLSGKALDQQRVQFKLVSAAMVALVDAHPPSKAVAENVYIVHCPMAPGDWLQTTEVVANPYYATAMKRCGEVVKTIAPAPSPDQPKDGAE